MDNRTQKALSVLNPRKAWIPILIGLAIVFFMIYSDPNVTPDQLRLIFNASFPVLVVAIFVLLARDIGYVYRIRTLTGKDLTWKSSLVVIILWEFASAVTPSVVGGTAVAIFILLKEKIPLGRAIAYVTLTAILDNMYFVVAAPIVLFLSGVKIFPNYTGGFATFFWISYALILAYTLIMIYAVYFQPRAFKWILYKVTALKFLRKWRSEALHQGDEIILASRALKGKKYSYWIRIIMATIFIWSARYLLLNTLISAFTTPDFGEHIAIFSRQVIMWIIMLISPTPGAAGVAEISFSNFFEGFLGDENLAINLIWRFMTYYFYIFLGVFVLPKWISKRFTAKKNSSTKAEPSQNKVVTEV